jgi:hypothetical protein
MELHFANIMVTAKFIVDSASPVGVTGNFGENDMQHILVGLKALAYKYASERGLKMINLQIAAALIATFVIRGQGRYRIVNTEPERSESADFTDY